MKKICILGIGGVGGYFGGKILSDKNSHEVTFIARGETYEVLQDVGLTVKSDQIIKVKPDRLYEDPKEIKEIDLLLVCVKSYDLNDAMDSVKHAIHDKTIIVPLLNGVDIYERIRKVIDKGYVLPSCVYVGTHIESPGVIKHKGGEGVIHFSNDPINPYPSIQLLKLQLKALGLDHEFHEDIWPVIWQKYTFIAAYGLVGAVTGLSLGQVYEEKVLFNDVREIMQDIKKLGDYKEIKLDSSIVAESLHKPNFFPYEAKPSFQREYEKDPNRCEKEIFGDTLIKMAKAFEIEIPTTNLYYGQLL